MLLAFGLPPVLQLARVPPLRVIRRDVGNLKPASLLVLGVGVAGFAALLLAVSSDLTLGLIAVGGFAGAVLLFSPGPGQTGITVTPTTGIVQAATLPTEKVQPSEAPPASTRVTTASPSPSMPVSVPQTGVWVEINSTSNYAGRIGNAARAEFALDLTIAHRESPQSHGSQETVLAEIG